MTAGQLIQEIAGTLPQSFYVSVEVSHTRFTTHSRIELEWSVYAAYYGTNDAVLIDNIRVTSPSVEQVYHRFHAEVMPWAKALMEGNNDADIRVP